LSVYIELVSLKGPEIRGLPRDHSIMGMEIFGRDDEESCGGGKGEYPDTTTTDSDEEK